MAKRILVAMVVGLSIWSPVYAAEDKSDPVVATVNGEEIRQSHVDTFRESLPAEAKALPPQTLFPMIVNSMVETKLVAAEARRKGMHDNKAFKSRIVRIENELLQAQYMKIFMTENLTEQLMQERYKDLVAKSLNSDEVHARHILLGSEADAKGVIAALDKGGDFVALAKKKSTGPSGPNGGDLGFFKASDMVGPFSKAAFAMKKGEHSKTAVKTQYGWHVILVVDRRKGAAPGIEESREKIVAEITRDLRTELMKRLSAKADIKILDGSGLDKAPKTK
ncbi:MAG: peptidylprolyl isomerase [Rhodospirillaceae bacterium]|jgi:peptidyl-prolyl cis-trans isomerase C|nr:peptidylprolyl isomerase [Rhodospirillaceae bacterium]MBT7769644.1 peptidylprolyl isomerase [Rhodospirillales bacterium]MBT4701854.1 peptidylprolyl isomerase [Rhodospirillaceae bacterium]MBT5036393.1 peptidylprolyl isomerase [Rhodospirillaceae bacterium]MBT6221540.1 peptidylprolyl isomerase [Rhodospirillaceae bacterium]